MRPYLKAGVITPEDLDRPEVRLRKVWAYEGVPQEVIEERIAIWQQNVERLRREGKYSDPNRTPRLPGPGGCCMSALHSRWLLIVHISHHRRRRVR